ncbi:hypothetical protein [Frigidibacter sp. ROC022]|uniref:hypothetical protein n=1 Tax=Frigidibacter sp. ROC022 TaxID=2971796 RepID=UPI0023DF63F0|nr:hypothetical protein [Frigidibacter sp. ROC022]
MRLWRWLRRLALALVLLILGLLSPVAYVELACRGAPVEDGYAPLIADPAWQRNESRTYTTYPEWHIVYAYEDYAEVLKRGDPQDFGYLRAITGFWSAACPLARTAAAHGGFDTRSKQSIYTIGVSFTLEMLMKAAYEETLGRGATWIRGPERSALDHVSARQAGLYSRFLHQVPWYKWDFRNSARELTATPARGFRDHERRLALGLEYRAKAVYAGLIERAVQEVGADQLRMRSIVAGLPPETLAALPQVAVIAERPEGVEIETPRYEAFNRLAIRIADAGGDFVEIAGNDQIMVTVLGSGAAPVGRLIHSARRQGFGDSRQLLELPVPELAGAIRTLASGPLRLEHVYDY